MSSNSNFDPNFNAIAALERLTPEDRRLFGAMGLLFAYAAAGADFIDGERAQAFFAARYHAEPMLL